MGTFFGALAVGVAQSVVIPYLPDEGLLATALRPSMPFLFMLIAILVQIRSAGVRDDIQSREVARLSTKAEANEAHVHAIMRDPRGAWDRWVGWTVLVVVLILVPIVFEQFWVGVIALGMAYSIALLSIRPVTGETNVVSLCQISFVGIGAIAAAQLSTTYGWDVTTSLIIGAVVAALCGLVVGIVCLPLGQLYAAITTFAFALLAEQVIYTRPTFSNNDSGVFLDRPTVAGIYLLDNTQFFYFATVVFFIVAGVLALLRLFDRRPRAGDDPVEPGPGVHARYPDLPVPAGAVRSGRGDRRTGRRDHRQLPVRRLPGRLQRGARADLVRHRGRPGPVEHRRSGGCGSLAVDRPGPVRHLPADPAGGHPRGALRPDGHPDRGQPGRDQPAVAVGLPAAGPETHTRASTRPAD